MTGSTKISAWTINPFSPTMGPIPDPPPMPPYDPNEEAPMYNWEKMRSRVWYTPGSELWPKVGHIPESDDKPDWRGVIKNNVTVWPNPGAYKHGQKEYPYFWFDTPDYADPFKKLWWSTKWTLWTGLFMTSFRACLDGKKASWPHTKSVMGRVFVPVVTVGFTGSLAVVTIANLRGCKDDQWNYAIAGAIAALTVGRNNFYRGFRYFFTLPFFAMTAKYMAENNLRMFPTFDFHVRNVGLSGNSTEYGVKSGDLRFGYRAHHESGRDVRDITRC